MLAQQAPNLLTLRDKTLHGRRRRVVSQAFSDNTLRSFESQIIRAIQALNATLTKTPDEKNDGDPPASQRDGWSAPKDMARSFDYLAFDIMTDVIFSAQYNTIGSDKFRYAIRAIEKSNVRLSVLVQAPELSIRAIQKTLFPDAIIARNRFVKFIRKLLGIRLMDTEVERKDIFSYIEKAKDPDTGKGLDQLELSAETATMIVAGSDTTSTTMAATLHYITHSPVCFKKVTEEVRSRFDSLDKVRMGPALNSCTYLRACVDEALRMSPPGGGPLWREVGEGGAVIDGVHIPPGYDVAVGIHSIHHNAVYFPDPYKFDPNRWMKSSDNSKASEMHKAYMPFGMGARSCVGRPLALQELMLTMATLLYQFEMRACDRDEDAWNRGTMDAEPFLLRDHVTGQKDGPLIEFQLRNVSN
ncbi:cytochrome P450 [Diaporthe sp. PMI_573]|nr:cytochrome P450 [Diaporthaceae sp. PMI_573]